MLQTRVQMSVAVLLLLLLLKLSCPQPSKRVREHSLAAFDNPAADGGAGLPEQTNERAI